MRKRLLGLLLVTSLALTACSSGEPASCWEYANHIEDLIDSGATAELEDYVNAHDEWVAERIMNNASDVEACAEAAFAALFSVGFSELEFELDG